MKEKISVKSLYEEFLSKKIKNTKATPNAVEDFIGSKLEVVEYLPFTEKRELCEQILEASCTKNGAIVEVDSVSRYILFTISVIAKYTNLKFENADDLDAIDQYDMLCKSGLLNYVLGAIGAEYDTCNNILNMMMADIDANNNNVAAVANKALQQILDYVGDFADVLSDKVESMQLDLNKIEIDKIMGVIDKLPKK